MPINLQAFCHWKWQREAIQGVREYYDILEESRKKEASKLPQTNELCRTLSQLLNDFNA